MTRTNRPDYSLSFASWRTKSFYCANQQKNPLGDRAIWTRMQIVGLMAAQHLKRRTKDFVGRETTLTNLLVGISRSPPKTEYHWCLLSLILAVVLDDAEPSDLKEVYPKNLLRWYCMRHVIVAVINKQIMRSFGVVLLQTNWAWGFLREPLAFTLVHGGVIFSIVHFCSVICSCG